MRARLLSTLRLATSLAGLPVLLRAATGPPTLAGLPTLGWVRAGLRDQYLPVEPLLHALGLLAWCLWAYAVVVVVLRMVAVAAARRQLAGSQALLAVSSLVTLPPLRSLVDAAVGLSLLASTTAPATPATTTLAAPVAAGRTIAASEPPAGWDRARPLLDAARTRPVHTRPQTPVADQPARHAPAPPQDPARPPRPSTTGTRIYTVVEGDSLWRIAEHELGDPQRWPEIFALNHGREMPDGRVVRHAGLIHPGWRLLLPPHPATPAPGRPEGGQPHPPPTATPTTASAPPTSTPPPPTTAPAPTSAPATTSPQPPVTSTPATAAPGTAPTTPASAPTTPQPGNGHDVVHLPSGSVVGISLAAAVAVLLELARRRRQRHRLPATPAPGIRHHDPASTETLRWLEQVARADDEDTGTDASPERGPASPPSERVARLLAGEPRHVLPGPVAVGARGGAEVTVDVFALGGLTVSGPGAAAAARAIATSILVGHAPAVVELLVVGDDPLGPAAALPGLRPYADLATALRDLHVELVHRARRLSNAELADFAALRQHDPGEPMPALLLVAAGEAGEHAGALRTVVQLGRRLGVGALLVGGPAAEAGGAAWLEVATDGTVRSAAPEPLAAHLAGVRLFTLTGSETAELMAAAAAARTDTAAPPSPASAPDEPFATPPPTATPAPLRVRLLGPYRIEARGAEVRGGLRRTARELLAYYLLHPDGAPAETAVDAMWPDLEPGKENDWFWTALGNLRTRLRNAIGGDAKPDVVARSGEAYQAEAGLFEVDLWQFQAALAQARDAGDDATVRAALRRAAELYRGDLLGGAYAWAEPARQSLRDRAVNALVRLAELDGAAGDDQAAVAALERTVEIDPYAEEPYRRLMRLHARLGRPDAAWRVYRRLAARLQELDVDPDEATEQLVREIAGEQQRRERVHQARAARAKPTAG